MIAEVQAGANSEVRVIIRSKARKRECVSTHTRLNPGPRLRRRNEIKERRHQERTLIMGIFLLLILIRF